MLHLLMTSIPRAPCLLHMASTPSEISTRCTWDAFYVSSQKRELQCFNTLTLFFRATQVSDMLTTKRRPAQCIRRQGKGVKSSDSTMFQRPAQKIYYDLTSHHHIGSVCSSSMPESLFKCRWMGLEVAITRADPSLAAVRHMRRLFPIHEFFSRGYERPQ